MTRETYADRVSRIAHDHNISGRQARIVADAELRIEDRIAARNRERARTKRWVIGLERKHTIRRSHVEGARYGRPVLIHNGGKP